MLCFSSSHSVPSSEVLNRGERIHNKFSFKNMPKCVARSETNLVNTDVAKNLIFFLYIRKVTREKLHYCISLIVGVSKTRTHELQTLCLLALSYGQDTCEPPCHGSSVVNDCKRGMMSGGAGVECSLTERWSWL